MRLCRSFVGIRTICKEGTTASTIQYAVKDGRTLTLADVERGETGLTCYTYGNKIVVKDGRGRFVEGRGRRNRSEGKHCSHTSNSQCHGEGPAHYRIKAALCWSINMALAMPKHERNWGIVADVLRNIYARGKYRDLILPMTVIRRLDTVLEPTKAAVLQMKEHLDNSGVTNQEPATATNALPPGADEQTSSSFLTWLIVVVEATVLVAGGLGYRGWRLLPT